jgi:hypothetical protein
LGLRGRKYQEAGGRLNDVELQKLIRMIKLRKMRWTLHVSCMGKSYNILAHKPEWKRTL